MNADEARKLVEQSKTALPAPRAEHVAAAFAEAKNQIRAAATRGQTYCSWDVSKMNDAVYASTRDRLRRDGYKVMNTPRGATIFWNVVSDPAAAEPADEGAQTEKAHARVLEEIFFAKESGATYFETLVLGGKSDAVRQAVIDRLRGDGYHARMRSGDLLYVSWRRTGENRKAPPRDSESVDVHLSRDTGWIRMANNETPVSWPFRLGLMRVLNRLITAYGHPDVEKAEELPDEVVDDILSGKKVVVEDPDGSWTTADPPSMTTLGEFLGGVLRKVVLDLNTATSWDCGNPDCKGCARNREERERSERSEEPTV